MLDNQKIVINPLDEEYFISKTEDKSEANFDRNLMDIAILTKDYIKKDKEFLRSIINEAKNSSSNETTFNKVFNNKTAINNEDINMLKTKIGEIKLYRNEDKLNGKSSPEEYEAAIYIPNLENADFSKEPIISAGFEIDNDEAGMEDFENYIIAFYNDEQHGEVELLLGETNAKSITNPVIIIVNSVKEESILEEVKQNAEKATSNFDLGVRVGPTFKINHRYDRSRKSEYEMVALQQFPSSSAGQYYWSGFLNYANYYVPSLRIADVDKRNIGKVLTASSTKYGIAGHISDISQKFVFWNTYEYDWYASYKNLGTFSRNGVPMYFRGRMKFANEWYSFDPNEVNNNPLPLGMINSSPYYGYTHTNSKGMQSFSKR